ncbi:cysteine hydrolase family protein [Acinetobacter gerneri]|uniref:cysteine hydrolase family protein n=1 Tax=Acinetobacter gerneri TaxID=202952 RepID=UPI0028B2205E|nr:cysteine hydrolase family protein [Acinetobacter gerneri]
MEMFLKNSALLIIDMQNGLFHSDDPPYQANRLLKNILQLIDFYKKESLPIVLVRHIGKANTPLATDHHFTQIIPEIMNYQQFDIILEKTTPSCFYKTDLAEFLKRLSIKHLVITGLKSDYCIDTTCRIAFEKDYKITLIKDAHSTVNNSFLSAEKIIEHHNTILGNAFVNLKTTNEFMQ